MSVIGSNLLAGASGQGGAYEIERSLRFNDGDDAFLQRTPSSAGNRKKFTWSGWVKRSHLGEAQILFTAAPASHATDSAIGYLYFDGSDQIDFFNYWSSAVRGRITTNALFRDVSAWYHIVLRVDTTESTPDNRFRLYVNGTEQTSFSSRSNPAQDLELYFNSTVEHKIGEEAVRDRYNFDGYMAEVNFVDGEALGASDFGETDTETGAWIPKKYTGSYGTNGFYLKFDPTVNLTTNATITAPFGGTAEYARVTDGLSVIGNTTTGSGFTLVQEDFGSSQTLSRYEVQDLYFTGGTSTFKLQYSTNGTSWTDGATFSVTASTQDFFGSLNVTARYVRLQATAFGTNGSGRVNSVIIYQDSFGADSSGNGNTWTLNNFGFFGGYGNDSLEDTPTNNWCTLNPLKKGTITVSEGSLRAAGGGDYQAIHGTTGLPSSGKFYWEATVNSTSGAVTDQFIGVAGSDTALSGTSPYPQGDTPALYYVGTGTLTKNGTGSVQTGLGAFAANDVIGVAYNADGATVQFYKNGTAVGTAESLPSTTETLLPAYIATTNRYADFNFGQRSFDQTPPTGYEALNTANLPEPTIKNGTEYFDIFIETGTGSSRAISPLSFQPDFLWAKGRNATSSHLVYDSVRGVDKSLSTDTSNGEDSTSGQLTSFDSNGYTLPNDTSGYLNYSGRNYVFWNWLAGGNSYTFNVDGNGYSTASAAGLSGGDITPTGASINTTSGISILKYTGSGTGAASIKHGLGVTPKVVIVKNLDTSQQGWGSWVVGHDEIGWGDNDAITLNSYSGTFDGYSTAPFGNTDPTSSAFYVGFVSGAGVNSSSDDHIVYAFAEVEGYSKFGAYTGNGGNNFVHCGFRPAWVMTKSTAVSNWYIFDTARNYNLVNNPLQANDPGQQTSNYNNNMDILSNGFCLKSSDTGANGTNQKYIFMAFAESPFKYANAR